MAFAADTAPPNSPATSGSPPGGAFSPLPNVPISGNFGSRNPATRRQHHNRAAELDNTAYTLAINNFLTMRQRSDVTWYPLPSGLTAVAATNFWPSVALTSAFQPQQQNECALGSGSEGQAKAAQANIYFSPRSSLCPSFIQETYDERLRSNIVSLFVGDALLLFEAYRATPDAPITWYRGYVFRGSFAGPGSPGAAAAAAVAAAASTSSTAPGSAGTRDMRSAQPRSRSVRLSGSHGHTSYHINRLSAVFPASAESAPFTGSPVFGIFPASHILLSPDTHLPALKDLPLPSDINIVKINFLPDTLYPAVKTELGLKEPVFDASGYALHDWVTVARDSLAVHPPRISTYSFVMRQVIKMIGLRDAFRILAAAVYSKANETNDQNSSFLQDLKAQRAKLVQEIAIGNQCFGLPQILLSSATGLVIKSTSCDGAARAPCLSDLTTTTSCDKLALDQSNASFGAKKNVSSEEPQIEVNCEANTAIMDIRAMHQNFDPINASPGAGGANFIDTAKIAVPAAPLAPSAMTTQHFARIMLCLDIISNLPLVAPSSSTVEFRFSVYSKYSACFLTDDFIVITDDAHGNDSRIAVNTPTRCRFVDMSPSDLATEVYLVCRVIRHAPLREGAFSSDMSVFRRSVALGVADLREVLANIQNIAHMGGAPAGQFGNMVSGNSPDIFTGGILSSSSMSVSLRLFYPQNENTFATMVYDMLHKGVSFEPLKADPIIVSMRAMQENISFSPASLNVNSEMGQPAVLGTAIFKNSNGPNIARRSLSDPVNPLSARSSVYVTLESAEFLRTLGKSFEVELSVRDSHNRLLAKSFPYGATGRAASEYNFCALYHCLTPKWNETVRIEVPTNYMRTSFLFFTVSFISKSSTCSQDRRAAFGVRSLITQEGSVIPEEQITLPLYKYDRKIIESVTSLHDICSSVKGEVPSSSPALQPFTLLKETLTFSVTLVSTAQTQSPIIARSLSLKDSADVSNAAVVPLLRKFKSVHNTEIAKFSVPYVKVLVLLFCDKKRSVPEIERLAFENLLHLLGVVFQEREPKYAIVRMLLLGYMDNDLREVDLAERLMDVISQLINNVRGNHKDIAEIRLLQATFKTIYWIFYLIVRCGQVLQADACKGDSSETNATEVQENEAKNQKFAQFASSLQSFLGCINELMSDSSEHLSSIQQYAYINFTQVVPLLSKLMPIKNLVKNVLALCETKTLQRSSLVQKRLSFVLSMITSEIFNKDPETRDMFNYSALRLLPIHLAMISDCGAAGHDQGSDVPLKLQILNECTSILQEMLSRYQLNKVATFSGNDSSMILSIADVLPIVFETLVSLVSSSNLQGVIDNKGSCLASIFSSGDNSGQTANMAKNYMLRGGEAGGMAGMSFSPFVLSGLNAAGAAGVTGRVLSARDYSQVCGDLNRVTGIFLSIVDVFPERRLSSHFLNMYNTLGAERTQRLIISFLGFIDCTMSREIAPQYWLNFKFSVHQVALKLLSSLSRILQRKFVYNAKAQNDGAQSFNANLWYHFYLRLTRLLSTNFTRVDHWTAQTWQCAYELNIPGLLSKGSRLLKSTWQSIGGGARQVFGCENQVHLVPLLVEQICELTASHFQDVFDAGAKILCQMILIEYVQTGSKKRIERQILSCLEGLIAESPRCNMAYRYRLIFAIRAYFSEIELTSEAAEVIDNTVTNIDRFIGSVLAFRSLPQGAEYEDELWSGIYKVAKFMRSVDRDDIFIRYIHLLAENQISSGNFLEAALTLKDHADTLSWSDNIIDAFPEIGYDSPQRECERKENLLRRMLQCFVQGKAWEHAIAVSKELIVYYDTVVFDYERQAENLQLQSKLYKAIVSEERYYSEYFRVGFYGHGFPPSIRNKQFIYRGQELEKIATFCERIQSKHPDSMILKTNEQVGPEVTESNSRYLQISAVKPEPNMMQPILQDHVHDAIRKFYMSNHVNKFSVSRPLRKPLTPSLSSNQAPPVINTQAAVASPVSNTESSGGSPETGASAAPPAAATISGAEAEFLNLWTLKTIYETEDEFPYLLRRSEVVNVIVTEHSPIENAVQTMQAKNYDLTVLERKWEKILASAGNGPIPSCNPFTMCINGAVDAPVNGGVNLYKKAFLRSNFAAEYPEYAEMVQKLEESILEQVRVLQRCLALHNRLVTPQMRPLHDNIVSMFLKNFADEIARLRMMPIAGNTPDASTANATSTSAPASPGVVNANAGNNSSPTSTSGGTSSGYSNTGNSQGNTAAGPGTPNTASGGAGAGAGTSSSAATSGSTTPVTGSAAASIAGAAIFTPGSSVGSTTPVASSGAASPSGAPTTPREKSSFLRFPTFSARGKSKRTASNVDSSVIAELFAEAEATSERPKSMIQESGTPTAPPTSTPTPADRRAGRR